MRRAITININYAVDRLIGKSVYVCCLVVVQFCIRMESLEASHAQIREYFRRHQMPDARYGSVSAEANIFAVIFLLHHQIYSVIHIHVFL